MIKIVLAFFLFLSVAASALSQQPTIAVVEKKLSQAKPDSNKVKLFNDLSVAYQESNPDKGINNAFKALWLSNELGWVKGMAISYRNIGSCHYYQSHPDSAVAYYNKTLQLAEQMNDNGLQADIYETLGFVYSDDNHKDYSKALKFRLMSLKFSEKTNDKLKTMHRLMLIGQDYVAMKQYDSAAKYWIKNIDIKRATGDTSYLIVYQNVGLAYMYLRKWQEAITYLQMGVTDGLAQNNKIYTGQVLQSIGNCYISLLDFKNALKAFESSLLAFQQSKDIYWQAVILNNIGNCYSDRQDYPNAIKYKFASLAIGDSIHNKKIIGTNENDLANDYTRNHEYDKALDLLLKASVIFEELRDQETLAQVYANLGSVYQIKGEKSKGEYYIQKSFQINTGENGKGRKAIYLHDLGIGYLKNGNPSKAFDLFHQSLLLSQQGQDKNIIALILGNMALAYLSILDKNELQKLPKNLQFSSSTRHLNYIISLVDSAIRLDTLIRDLNLLQAHYAIISTTYELKKDYSHALAYYKKYIFYKDSLFNGEKMKQIIRLESQIEINKRDAKIKEAVFENKLQKSRTKIIIVRLLLAAIILLATFYFLYKRKRYKLELELLNFQLQVKEFQLQISDVKQEALNAQMSEHFVGNAMHSIKLFIDNNEKDNAVLYLDRFRQLTRRVIKNAPKRLVLLQEDLNILEDYVELEKLRFSENTFEYHIIVDPEINSNTALLPPMVLQVLTENAIKHGFRKSLGGKLKIEILKKDNLLRCIVQDNGIGRKAAAQTKREDAESYGTSLAERLIRISSNYAKQTSYKIIDLFDIDDLPIGTRVEITLPYITNEENL